MATDSMVAGLFATPEMYQQQQDQLAQQQAIQMAQLSPEQRAQADIRGGFQRAGNAIGGLMGAQDPQMKLAAMQQQVLQGLNPNDPVSMTKAAEALAQAGDQQGAMQLAQRALEVRNVESQISGRTEEKQAARAMQDAQFQAKLAADKESKAAALEASKAAKAQHDETLRFIAGQHDATMRVLAAQKQGTVKPLAPGLQAKEDADLTLLSSAEKQQASLLPVISSLTPDEKTGKPTLVLGPLVNKKYEFDNARGVSTPASNAYAQFKSAVDSATNIAIQADKGVATDSDVLRHAKALMAAYSQNDTEASRKALIRFNEAVTNEAENTRKRIDSRRASQGVETYFGTGARAGASNVTGANAGQPSGTNKVKKWSEL